MNESVGARVNLPLGFARTDSRRFNFSGGVDARHFGLESFNTNNFIITTVVTNAQGSQTIESRVASPQPARKNNVNYLPLTAAIDFSRTDLSGTTSANLAVSGNVTDDDTNFGQLAYSPDTDSLYAKLNLAFARDLKLGGDWSLLVRASGQIATGPLLGIEQFSVGGLNSVRGYMEGDEFGDHGWFGSVELRSPFLLERVPVGSDYAPVWLRGTAFVDAGQRFLQDTSATTQSVRTLMGSGFGVSANLNNRLDLRIVVGWPLFETLHHHRGSPRLLRPGWPILMKAPRPYPPGSVASRSRCRWDVSRCDASWHAKRANGRGTLRRALCSRPSADGAAPSITRFTVPTRDSLL